MDKRIAVIVGVVFYFICFIALIYLLANCGICMV
jgi:hypothetical protein